jgi:PAS domain S-box-containing protein
MLGISTLALALVLVALVAIVVWRERRTASLVNTASELDRILRTGRFALRVPARGVAAPFAATANRLLEHIAVRDLQLQERERTFAELLGSMNEALAVHQRTLVFANSRFASLLGADDPQKLVGHSLVEWVNPDYAELLGNYLEQWLSGGTAPERLEVELHPASGRAARMELSAARIDYQSATALVLTLVEMAPRPLPLPITQRSRSLAGDTLD